MLTDAWLDNCLAMCDDHDAHFGAGALTDAIRDLVTEVRRQRELLPFFVATKDTDGRWTADGKLLTMPS